MNRKHSIIRRAMTRVAVGIVLIATCCPSFAAEPAPAPSLSAPRGGIVPKADRLLTQLCEALGSADAFSFHAEIQFDQVVQSDVKLQFAAAMDFELQRPDELAIDYHSDLGSKRLWYSGDTLTIFDRPDQVYASVKVPTTIDGMLEHAAATRSVTVPLSDFAQSDQCQGLRKKIVYGGYAGIGDVNGTDCDHVAYSSATTDWQLWLDRSGKPIPRKVVVTYRSLPGAPEWIALLSDWKFSKEISASQFRPDLPKDAKRIDILKIKESKP